MQSKGDGKMVWYYSCRDEHKVVQDVTFSDGHAVCISPWSGSFEGEDS